MTVFYLETMPTFTIPDKATFTSLLQGGYNKIPVSKRLSNPKLTPHRLYEHLQQPNSFLLESSRIGLPDGRYSIIGFDPFLIFKSKGTRLWLNHQPDERNPIAALREILENWRGPQLDGLPPFVGGAIGYFGYECNHYFERLPRHHNDDLQIPDIYLLFLDKCVVFDHHTHELLLIAAGNDYTECTEKIAGLEQLVSAVPDHVPVIETHHAFEIEYQSNFTRESYLAAIARIKKYIQAGDTFQVNLSQRLQASIRRRPFHIYRRLCDINPVHFASFFCFDDFSIISASPERLVKVSGDYVCTRPIAGTRRRGSPEEEQRFIDELLHNEKEQAEHAMLVDLERNDMGRVCNYGSVKVSRLMEIIKYSHVMHIESLIEGQLAKDKTALDVLAAMFPGGTITGVPKIRTMEIITELEPNVRGVYTGSIGYLSFSNIMDLNIVIRTILVKDDIAYIQAGGGIVQDAIPEREFSETLYKARAQLEAL